MNVCNFTWLDWTIIVCALLYIGHAFPKAIEARSK